ncbi:hypothetical protein [Streptomyces sp. NBC_01508]|uniref:hypothetical protein n=1 Tax=Streptomyces sp. NBC_01508 TaxID=2903888 RepID=UPI003867D08A
MRAARCAESPIQIEGAIGLTFEHVIDQHRALLREVVTSWPPDAGGRARIVRNELDE